MIIFGKTWWFFFYPKITQRKKNSYPKNLFSPNGNMIGLRVMCFLNIFIMEPKHVALSHKKKLIGYSADMGLLEASF